MNKFKIITCGDKNYFEFLWRFENNIFKKTGEYPIIYDLGLTDLQKATLKSKIFRAEIPADYSDYTASGFIKTTHKPFCIIDFFNRYNFNCIYLDADILIRNKIRNVDFIFNDFDIAVTPRHSQEKYIELFENGLINAGVILFSNNDETKKFVNIWINECKNENTSDQLALSNLIAKNKTTFFELKELVIEDVRIKLLDPKKYNDVSLTKGLILHFKNAGRFKQAFKRYKFEYYMIQNNIPMKRLYVLFIKINNLLNNN